MEAIVRPFYSWDEWPEATREFFKAQRTPAGEELILQKTFLSNISYLFAVSPRKRWRSTADPLETLALPVNQCA